MSDELTHWLEISTAKLRPQHARRVWAEVEAHYHDAVSDYLSQGKTQHEAEQAAFADLGDPQATARALRRTYHTRRAALQRFTLRLFAGRLNAGNLLLLVLLGLGAAQLVPATIMRGGLGDITIPTMHALLLQTAMCTLALSLPLYFGDLDLSLGAVVMMGAVIVRPPRDMYSEMLATPIEIQSALILAVALGIGIGLLHGLLTVTLRMPTAKITLISGFILALILSTFKQIEYLALDSSWRLSLYRPTLQLFLAVVVLTVLAAIAASRLRPMVARADQPILGKQPHRTWRNPIQQWGDLFLLLILLIVVPMVGPAGYVTTMVQAIIAIVATLRIALSLARNNKTSTEQRQPMWQRLGKLLITAALLIPPVTALAAFNSGLPLAVLLFPLTLFVIILIVVVAAFVLRSPARLWLVIPARPAFREHSMWLIAARVTSLTLCSTIAAIIGVLMCAQGIRDNTFLLCASYFVLVPLAGLIIGGQHILTGWQRLAGVVLGALFTAAICLGLSQPGDNLGSGGVIGILLAALAVVAWSGAAGIRAAAQRILHRQTLAESEADVEPSWKEVRAG
ncbi:MAG TPA: permease prefix domain 1-containing protein [Herpetosiphonaceae bacterium]